MKYEMAYKGKSRARKRNKQADGDLLVIVVING